VDNVSLNDHRLQITTFGKQLLQVCGIEFSQTSELQRQICGAFLFGGVFAYAKQFRLSPPEVQALAITMLKDVLSYNAGQAGGFSARLIQASSAGSADTMNRIIHRGIDGYAQLEAKDNSGLHQNLHGVFEAFNAKYE